MEVVQVQPRDSYLHYVHVPRRDTTLKWSFTTRRKTVGFGLYRRLGQTRLPSSSKIIVLQRQSSVPGSNDQSSSDSGTTAQRPLRPPTKSAAATKLSENQDILELIPIQVYDASKSKIEGSFTVNVPGNYILVFDNTFSRNTAKVVSFSVTLLTDRVESEPVPCQETVSGWLWKRKRKMMQGWAKRWFHLSPTGVLSYATSPTSVTRGSIQMLVAAISSNPLQRLIHIDSGTMLYHLKAHTTEHYERWMAALCVFSPATLSPQPPPPPPPLPLSDSAIAGTPSVPVASTEGQRDAIPSLAVLETSVNSYMKTVDQFVHLTLQLWPRYTVSDPRVSSLLPLLKEQQEKLSHALAVVTSTSRTMAPTSVPHGAHQTRLSVLGHHPSAYAPSYHPSALSEPYFDALDENGLVSPEDSDADDQYDDPETEIELEDQHTAKVQDDWLARWQPVAVSRRTKLPAPAAGDGLASALAMFRKNLGKDLSTVAMPVSMNEPLNFLQRACEELEYFDLLETAAQCVNPSERLLYVAAFVVSGYASSQYRTGRKPFNPMMTETYENIRPDKRFRFVAEKVSHNPLIIAAHTESKYFVHWQCVKINSKFWGKSMEFTNQGTHHITLTGHNDHYTYCKPSSWLRNMLAGEKYLEHVGEVRVVNHTTGDYAIISFKEGKGGSFFSVPKQRNDVVVTVYNKHGQQQQRAVGKWSEQLVKEVNASPSTVIWQAQPPGIDHHSDYYGFTRFCVELNEMTAIEKGALPKTDTRLRPDQRLYEQGLVDDADAEKQRLENKQRERRKALAEAGVAWKPRWFVLAQDRYADPDEQGIRRSWQYNGQYWPTRESGQWPDDLYDLW